MTTSTAPEMLNGIGLRGELKRSTHNRLSGERLSIYLAKGIGFWLLEDPRLDLKILQESFRVLLR